MSNELEYAFSVVVDDTKTVNRLEGRLNYLLCCLDHCESDMAYFDLNSELTSVRRDIVLAEEAVMIHKEEVDHLLMVSWM